ncbi:hypothetical protein [Skermania piniformis]|uniref:Uncharacterized protein n=1 Tax=Skermania pinensis TaxID=39122 RepID=A0ABX8S693_9ACTN|nr:hypothetical protein [Skermania piniformis]QXQ12514.1 hypothetical protein KV203_11025 [Skermania piniformis]
MPPYPVADWSAESTWWAPGRATATSRRSLVAAWVVRAAAPKPRKKEFVDELKGWSGALAKRDWVRAHYGVDASCLARTDRSVDLPDEWDKVSALYREFGDGLARFSAGFGKVPKEWRPAGLPAKVGDSVKCYEWKVPPRVRAVMIDPEQEAGGGGVLEDRSVAEAFLADPDSHASRYRPVAVAAYAVALIVKLDDFDPDSREIIARQIDRLCPGGWPTVEIPDAQDWKHATDIVDATVSRLPIHPVLAEHRGEAWRRARKTIAHQLAKGERVDDVRIIYLTKLGDSARDAQRVDRRRAEHERPTAPHDLSEMGSVAMLVGSAETDGRAAAALAAYPAPAPDGSGDSWEKRFALELLTGTLDREGAPIDSPTELARRIRARWRVAGRPPDALSANPTAAIGLVRRMVLIALNEASAAPRHRQGRSTAQ